MNHNPENVHLRQMPLPPQPPPEDDGFDYRSLLTPIAWTLKTGEGRTRAMLALDDLCEQLGIDRDSLRGRAS